MGTMKGAMLRVSLASLPISLVRLRRDAAWYMRRGWGAVFHRFGHLAWLVPVCAGLSSGAFMLERRLSQSLAAAMLQAKQPVQTSNPSDARRRPLVLDALSAFDANLLAHADIPRAVEALLQMARAQGLAVPRAEYTVHVDPAGQFMRYRMVLPIKGNAEAANRFIFLALRSQSAVALKNVQLKRDQAESAEIEARTEWDFLTRLPVARADMSPQDVAKEGAR